MTGPMRRVLSFEPPPRYALCVTIDNEAMMDNEPKLDSEPTIVEARPEPIARSANEVLEAVFAGRQRELQTGDAPC